MRSEMRKRYEMIREAAEIKRDDTFKPYRAQKVKGRPHPDAVIESIALSSVPVPDVTLKPDLPRFVIDQGKLSDLQLEAVVYSKQVSYHTHVINMPGPCLDAVSLRGPNFQT